MDKVYQEYKDNFDYIEIKDNREAEQFFNYLISKKEGGVKWTSSKCPFKGDVNVIYKKAID